MDDEHTHPADRITHLGSAVVTPRRTGTIETAQQFETPAGRFVLRTTTASEVVDLELLQVMADGTEVHVDAKQMDYVSRLSQRAHERRAAFRVIEGGAGQPEPTTPPTAPSQLPAIVDLDEAA